MKRSMPHPGFLGLVFLTASLTAGQIEFPPWCADNMVLQRPTPDHLREVLLWGTLDHRDTVLVHFGRDAKPIQAETESLGRGASGLRWWISYAAARDRLPSSQPFTIVVTTRKSRSRAELNQVRLGDVWLFGQKLGEGVPVPPDALAGAAARAAGRAFVIAARSARWTNDPAPVTLPWIDAAGLPAHTNQLANVAAYLVRQLALTAPDLPVAVLAVPWEDVINARRDPPAAFQGLPECKAAWDAAQAASRQAGVDCEGFLREFQGRIRQLKREGRVLEPPPQPPDPPQCLHRGNFPFLPMSVRGGIW